MARARISTRTGDDGTTGLVFGGRVRKDDRRIEALGTIDEAQAAIGMARAEAGADSPLARVLTTAARDLYTVMAEVATAPEDLPKLTARPDEAMVAALDEALSAAKEQVVITTDFVLPGEDRVSAALHVARTVVRRAERVSLDVVDPSSSVVPYLNRLSDLLFALARVQEGDPTLAKGADQ